MGKGSKLRFETKEYIGEYTDDDTSAFKIYDEDGELWVIVEYRTYDPKTDTESVYKRVIIPYEHYKFDMYMDNIDDVDHEMESYYSMIDGDEDEYPDYYPGAFDDFFR